MVERAGIDAEAFLAIRFAGLDPDSHRLAGRAVDADDFEHHLLTLGDRGPIRLDRDQTVGGAGVGDVDRGFPKSLLDGPILGLGGRAEVGAVGVLQRSNRGPKAPVGLGLAVGGDPQLFLHLEIGSRQVEGKVLVEAAGVGVFGPIGEPIVCAAAIGLQPDREDRCLVRVLGASLHHDGNLVALGRVGVVDAVLAEVELQLLGRVVVGDRDAGRGLESRAADEIVAGVPQRDLNVAVRQVAQVVGSR